MDPTNHHTSDAAAAAAVDKILKNLERAPLDAKQRRNLAQGIAEDWREAQTHAHVLQRRAAFADEIERDACRAGAAAILGTLRSLEEMAIHCGGLLYLVR
jgi:hypothetical protein